MAVRAIHPGEHPAKELEEHCMSAADLARQLSIPGAGIVDILNGRSAITVEMAVQLAHVFDTSARFWLDLQNQYDLAQRKRKSARA